MAFVNLNTNECRFEFTDIGKKYMVSSDALFTITVFSISDDDINYESDVEPVYITEILGTSNLTNKNDIKYKILK